MHLMTPRAVQCSAHNFKEFFGPNQKSLSLKMAEIWPNSNRFEDIGTFLSKKLLMRSHLTRNALDDLRAQQCSAHDFIEFFGPNQKTLSLKMAEIWPIL